LETTGRASVPKFTYGEIERILASLHCANDARRRTTLRSRIKHFQKLGVPFDLRSGRGKKLEYDRDHIYQWALCLELAEFGIDPAVTVKLLRTNWERMFVPSFQGKDWRNKKKPLGEFSFLVVLPELASAAWYQRPKALFPGILDFDIVPKSRLPAWIADLTGDARRLSILNLGETVRLIEEQIALLGKDKEPEPEPDIEAEQAKKFEAERRRGEEAARALLEKIRKLREADK
jgi:hypothetical protein